MLIESATAALRPRRLARLGRHPSRASRHRAAAGVLAAALAVAAGTGSAAVGQSPPGAPPSLVLGEEVSVDYILVPVVVRRGGAPAPDLEAASFELAVDGRPVPIDSFEGSAEAPVSLLLLQDLSGSMELGGRLDLARRLTACLLAASRPSDRLALATFASGEVRLLVPFGGSPAELGARVAGWRGWGTTALHDAVSWLPEAVVPEDATRRAALLVTDGVDNASRMSPAAARERVRASHLPVYVVSLREARPAAGEGAANAGGATAADPVPATAPAEGPWRFGEVLATLAEETGGALFTVTSPGAVPGACAAVLADLRYQYVVGFAAAGTGAVGPHRIEVRLKGQGYEVAHRLSYEGRAPAAFTGG